MTTTNNGKAKKGMRDFDFRCIYEVLMVIIVTPALVHVVTVLNGSPII